MNRRTFLTGAVCLGVGAGGYAVLSDDVDVAGVASGIGDATGTLSTDNEIGRVTFRERSELDTQPFKSITFYESGAARVAFYFDHESDRFALTHGSLSVLESPYEIWDSPKQDGEKIINAKQLIVENGPYPRNEFMLGVYFEEAENFYMGNRNSRFEIPGEWYDAAQSA